MACARHADVWTCCACLKLNVIERVLCFHCGHERCPTERIPEPEQVHQQASLMAGAVVAVLGMVALMPKHTRAGILKTLVDVMIPPGGVAPGQQTRKPETPKPGRSPGPQTPKLLKG